jgi:hypothetical protein
MSWWQIVLVCLGSSVLAALDWWLDERARLAEIERREW